MHKIKLLVCLVASAVLATTTAYAASYTERYTANPEASIAASSRQGNWAAADTASGATAEQVLDAKLRFIEEVYAEKQELFIVTEGIAAGEIENPDSLRYLFEHSAIYRELIAAQDTLYIRPSTSFGKLIGDRQNPVYERYAFHLEKPQTIELNISYRLAQGKLSVLVVSPEGEILYRNDATTSHIETVSIPMDAGIMSVVFAYEMDGGHCSGDISVMGKVL